MTPLRSSALDLVTSVLVVPVLVASLGCGGEEDSLATRSQAAVDDRASPATSGAVVINEIMYHPPSDLEELQYVELFNPSEKEVDLSGWSFTRGIRFTFPTGTKLAPVGFLVVSRNVSRFSETYGDDVPTVGNFEGRLSHSKDLLVLCDPGGRAVDSVSYSDGGRWPAAPDGYSPSLERITPAAKSQTADNWSPSTLPDRFRAAGTPGRRNDSYSANLPPAIRDVEHWPRCPTPNTDVVVTANISDRDGVAATALLYTVVTPGRESEEVELAMERAWGDDTKGTFRALIPGQPDRHLVRFRVRARDKTGTERLQPSEDEPCRTYSYFTYENTEKASIPIGFIVDAGSERASSQRGGRWPPFRRRGGYSQPERTRGNSAFVYVPAGGNEYYTFDHVRTPSRSGGFKVRFHGGQRLRGMSVINLIFEYQPRFVLAEPLAYELYRMAGVPAELAEHVRLWVGDRMLGYHLLVEQPNRAFLRRNNRDTSGNLYKLLWYGHGILGKHEKKTNVTTGHDDLVALVNGLNRTTGKEQWEFIQQHFHVEEFASYFAVNMCISNWDGFFNNYFTYHDTGETGKWEIYPWDEDKTWGDYDGASSLYDFYDMPLTFGMNHAPSVRRGGGFGGPFGGGASWWRPPGFFSGPLLANPYFRERFLARLKMICETIFTRERLFPIINGMARRLEPEVRLRAERYGRSVQSALREFQGHIESFRQQVIHRREFILSQTELKVR